MQHPLLHLLSNTGLQFYISAEDRLIDSYKASGLTLNHCWRQNPRHSSLYTRFSLEHQQEKDEVGCIFLILQRFILRPVFLPVCWSSESWDLQALKVCFSHYFCATISQAPDLDSLREKLSWPHCFQGSHPSWCGGTGEFAVMGTGKLLWQLATSQQTRKKQVARTFNVCS